MGPTIFLVSQGPIITGPRQFQKRNSTPCIATTFRGFQGKETQEILQLFQVMFSFLNFIYIVSYSLLKVCMYYIYFIFLFTEIQLHMYAFLKLHHRHLNLLD